MDRKLVKFALLLGGVLVFVGCGTSSPNDQSARPAAADGEANGVDEAPIVTRIEAGPNAHVEAQEALILAEPGEIIEFGPGTFQFSSTLSLDGIENITIRGQGIDKTVLTFAGQEKGTGGEGVKITQANHIRVEDLTIEDSPGDALKIEGCQGVAVRRVKTWWTRGPHTENGGYGIYPVLCSDVLVEDSEAQCASDAGIYVGQSQRVVVRRCRAERNVAGIEIENVIGADVYENEATNNAGGMLVFSLPGLKIKNGHHCRIFNNHFYANNHPNFAAKGNIVAMVPPGTGMMVMANDHVEVFNNRVHDNITANCTVVSFLLSRKKFDDPQYDPYPEAVYIHDNEFANGGTDPQGELGILYAPLTGGKLADIVIDGVVDERKLVDGRLPPELGICIANNGDATFLNVDFGRVLNNEPPEISRELPPCSGSFEPLPPIEIAGVE